MAKFEIKQAGSTINWTGKKILGLHTGTVNVASGWLEQSEGVISRGEIVVDMSSITVTDIEDKKTHDEFLAHLQNDDFFSVNVFKLAKLVIASSTQEKFYQGITGALTIKDITHPFIFNARVEVFTDYLHAMGEVIIDRTMYNIRYGSGRFIDNLGDKLIHDEFVLQFKLIGKRS